MLHRRLPHRRNPWSMLCRPGSEPTQRPPDSRSAQSDIALAITNAMVDSPPKGLYRLQPPAARSVAATDVTSVYQTDVTSAAPTDTLCLCSNVSVGPADIKSVWATDVTSVASGRRYRGGL
ncbi:hypothetical protein PCANC_25558 [Puccinia coronata f. sp. avenae]|uniref:Uncharacterized protein n=1 Tax=Puccinia coronata f. sp. avenae TaxID=200324 RepID=A0A2N5TWN0_9BASI|nr:hypothetical protein PCANC_25558 [Puccinia coronata f. sp. avenae]